LERRETTLLSTVLLKRKKTLLSTVFFLLLDKDFTLFYKKEKELSSMKVKILSKKSMKVKIFYVINQCLNLNRKKYLYL